MPLTFDLAAARVRALSRSRSQRSRSQPGWATASGSSPARERVRQLAANTSLQVHFTLTSGSWLNLVEVSFGIIERQAIHGGTFRSVRDLIRGPDGRELLDSL